MVALLQLQRSIGKNYRRDVESKPPSQATQIMNFTNSLPAGSNVYAELIPFLNASASQTNPEWMSYLLLPIMMMYLIFCIMALKLLYLQVKRRRCWLIRRLQNGLLQPNGVMFEIMGAILFSMVGVIEMCCQLYTDRRKVPLHGKILLNAFKYPVAWITFWCVTWGCLSNAVRAKWNPTFMHDAKSSSIGMPMWVVCFLNGIFVFLAAVFLVVNPLMAIPPHQTYTQLLNTLKDVNHRLRVASASSDAIPYSPAKLSVILDPIHNFPNLMVKLTTQYKKMIYFTGALAYFLLITYIIFLYLTFTQYRTMVASVVQVEQNSAAGRKLDYRVELRTLLIEALLLFIVILTYIPIFAWAITCTSAQEFAVSRTSLLISELSFTMVVPFIGIAVMQYRIFASQRILVTEQTPTLSSPMINDGHELQDGSLLKRPRLDLCKIDSHSTGIFENQTSQCNNKNRSL